MESPRAAIFVDRTADLGIGHVSPTGSRDRLFIFENLGTGGAFLDADADGRLDVLLAGGGVASAASTSRPGLAIVPGPGPKLYLQRVDGVFEDATERSGLRHPGWTFGVAVGDIDNDGDADVFLTSLAEDRLYVNLGGGRFEDRTRESGLGDNRALSTSAVFLDFDRDGALDLYVANYVHFDLERLPNDGKPCTEKGILISCGPPMHAPAADRLYRNRGDGRFEDVSERAGIAREEGAYGLGVAAGDVDRDGWPDIYVANDTTANFLWRNRGDGTFEDTALFAGVALSENGQGQAGMGVDLADPNGDGWLDIHVTNYQQEPNAYYESVGSGAFADRSASSGLGPAALAFLGWGTKFLDYDADGRLDVVAVNGHVHPRAAELGAGATFEQRSLLFHNLGGGRFGEVLAAAAGDLGRARNHRGLAVGDWDQDGDPDLLVTLLDAPPRLFENRSRSGRSIAFVLRGQSSTREGIGSRIEVRAGGRTQSLEVTRGGSYLSSHDVAVCFGIGEEPRIESGRVAWTSGTVQDLGTLEAGALYQVSEARGEVEMLRRFKARD